MKFWSFLWCGAIGGRIKQMCSNILFSKTTFLKSIAFRHPPCSVINALWFIQKDESKSLFFLSESGPTVLIESTVDNGVIQSENYPKLVPDTFVVKRLPKTQAGYKIYVTDLTLDDPNNETNE